LSLNMRRILKSKSSTVTLAPMAEPIAQIVAMLHETRLGVVMVHDVQVGPSEFCRSQGIVRGLTERNAGALETCA